MSKLVDNYLLAIEIVSNVTGIPITELTIYRAVRDLCKFEESYSDMKLIGEGGFGIIFRAFMKNSTVLPLAIKISRPGIKFGMDEVHIMKRLRSDILENNVSPHVPIYICTYDCKEVEIEDIDFDDSKVIVMELLGLTLSSLVNDDDEVKHLDIYMFQLLLLLYALDKTFGNFKHNDITMQNIVFRDSISVGYTQYDYGENQYFLPNTGKQLILIDYGLSKFVSSKKKDTDWYDELSSLAYQLGTYDYDMMYIRDTGKSYLEILNDKRFNEFKIPKDNVKLLFRLKD